MSVGGVGSGSAAASTGATGAASGVGQPAVTQTGRLGYAPFAAEAVLSEVLAGNRTVGVGDNGSHVKALEEALVALGYPLHWRTQPNESLTATTRNAIAHFQRDNGLSPTGTLDGTSLAALDAAAQQALGTQAPSGPRPTDHVAAHVLAKHGLSTTDMRTASTYEGTEWGTVGYYPYFGEAQYTAFAKHASVFGGAATGDSHAFFEMYANPPGGLDSGSWIGQPFVKERDFERTAGVDVSSNRRVDDVGYKLLRTAGAPGDAVFALRDAAGAQLPTRRGDRLVPTVIRDGAPVEVDVDGDSRYRLRGSGNVVRAVTWRLKRDDAIVFDASHRAESRTTLLGLGRNIPFDFIDAAGEPVPFRSGTDRIVESWRSGNTWHALARQPDGSFEHQTIRGDTVRSTNRVSADRARDLKAGETVIRRVQDGGTGALLGDGDVGAQYDMSWWGKCHNVASISATDMPRPSQPVNVITNLNAGDAPALQWRTPTGRDHHVLKAKVNRQGTITGYEHQTRARDGSVRDTEDISTDEATRLAAAQETTAVIVRSDGTLKPADVTAFDTTSLTSLVSHIGDGAVRYESGTGERYYAHPDVLLKKDGTQVLGHVKSVRTAGGRTHHIGERRGLEFAERDRSELRAPGMTSRVMAGAGGERMAFNFVRMDALNGHRGDDITELVLLEPDGTERVIRARDVEMLGWENQFDFRPDALWGLHGRVTKDRTSVIESSSGTQVWNYAIRDVKTDVIDPATLSHSDKITGARPGMLAGTVGRDGKTWFETKVEHDGGEETYRYWVRFDAQGDVQDYSYVNGEVPDFIWTQFVKTDRTWVGMSQAPGVRNRDIQKLYHASLGRLDAHTMPGGFITEADLKSAAPAAPPTP